MNPNRLFVLFASLTAFAAVAVHAQDLGGAGSQDEYLGGAREEETIPEGSVSHVIYSKTQYSVDAKEVKIQKKGEAEKIEPSSVEVAVSRDGGVHLIFQTESRATIAIPFFSLRKGKAEEMAKRIRDGASIDVSSCAVEEPVPGSAKLVEVGALGCRYSSHTSVQRVIRCSKTNFTPILLIGGSMERFYERTSLREFENQLVDRTDGCVNGRK